MSANPKWLLGLFMLFALGAMLCLVTEASFIGTQESGALNDLQNIKPSITGVESMFKTMWNILTWNYSFLNEGIGLWVKIPLILFSIAIFLPLSFEVARIVIPWAN